MSVPARRRNCAAGHRRRSTVFLTGLAPAYFDVHIHGSAGHDVMEDSREGERGDVCISRASRCGRISATDGDGEHRSHAGCGGAHRGLDRARPPEPGARPLEIHLEGPFISHARRGVHPPAQIQPPDIALFDRFYEAARGHVRLMTLAPRFRARWICCGTLCRAACGFRLAARTRLRRRRAPGLRRGLLPRRTPATRCADLIIASPGCWAWCWTTRTCSRKSSATAIMSRPKQSVSMPEANRTTAAS